MKTRSLLWIAALVCGLSLDSLAQPAPSATASAGVAASASASARVVIPPWPAERDAFPALDAEPFPDDKTKAPDAADWKNAVQVRFTRLSPGVPTGCRAWRVREWMKVHCDLRTSGIRLLAGNTEGVALFVARAAPFDVATVARQLDRDEALVRQQVASGDLDWAVRAQAMDTTGRFGQVVFPVRRGDRRVFEWLQLEIWEGYDGPPSAASSSTMILEERWPEGEAPQVALLKR